MSDLSFFKFCRFNHWMNKKEQWISLSPRISVSQEFTNSCISLQNWWLPGFFILFLLLYFRWEISFLLLIFISQYFNHADLYYLCQIYNLFKVQWTKNEVIKENISIFWISAGPKKIEAKVLNTNNVVK